MSDQNRKKIFFTPPPPSPPPFFLLSPPPPPPPPPPLSSQEPYLFSMKAENLLCLMNLADKGGVEGIPPLGNF